MRYQRKPYQPKTEMFVPPAEILENTKARRAWCAAKLAELQAQGRDARITGVGTYQHVSAKLVKESKGTREQTRGLCQGCGREWALKNGVITHHGYKRPGGGWQTSSCSGARYAPLSKSCDRTEHLIGHFMTRIEQLRRDIERASSRSSLPYEKPVGYGRREHMQVTPENVLEHVSPRFFGGFRQPATAWDFVVECYRTAARRELTELVSYKVFLETIVTNYRAGVYKDSTRTVEIEF